MNDNLGVIMEFEMSLAESCAVKQCMLKILKKVHEICEKHNIKYWLDYGTLLGAVRHNGFIPWDDDLDISMLRDDYEKWCEIAPQELGEEFFWQTVDTEPEFHLCYGKVRLVGTSFYAATLEKSAIRHKGVNIDVFPVDYVPESKLQRRLIQKFYLLFSMATAVKRLHIGRFLAIKKMVYFFVNTKLLWKFCMLLTAGSNKRNNKNVSMWYMYLEKYLCPAETFNKLVLHKFEDGYFYIPEDYNAHLTRLYSDYMQLPPVEERIGKHMCVCCDLGKYARQ